MANKNSNWLSFYIFYSTDHNTLLSDALEPLKKQLWDGKKIDSHFFIRYHENGPHIRFRILPSNLAERDILQKEVTEYFNNYIQNHPSAPIPNAPYNWVTNNSVHVIDYVPETDRYGGIESMSLSEYFFRVSSDIVLDIIKTIEGISYDKILGIAIKLYVSFAYSHGMTLNQAINFYSNYFQNWSMIHYYNLSQEEIISKQTQLSNEFTNAFAIQSHGFIRLVNTIWDALKENIDFEEEWLNKWISENKKVYRTFRQLEKNNKLIVKEAGSTATINYTGQNARLNVMASHIHMLNNRLGIRNEDESYVAFLTYNAIRFIK